MDEAKGLCCIIEYNVYSFPVQKISIQCDVVHTTAIVSAEIDFDALNKLASWTKENEAPDEVVYRLPLDEGAAVFSFEARVNEKVLRADIMERKEAKATYEKAVESGHTAFLMSQSAHSDDVFEIRLGMIPVDAPVKVLLKYITTLDSMGSEDQSGGVEAANNNHLSAFRLHLPSVLNPRYNPVGFSDEIDLHSLSISDLPYKFEFYCNLRSHLKLASVDSGNDLDHFCIIPGEIQNRFHIKLLESENKEPAIRTVDLSLIVHYQMEENQQNLPIITFEPASKIDSNSTQDAVSLSDVIQLEFTPKFSSKIASNNEKISFEFIFLIDRSGSMSGSNIECAKNALMIMLKSLPTNCFLQIVGFGSTHTCLFPTAVEYNEANLATAVSHQKGLYADLGGTEVLTALKDVLEKSIHPKAAGRKVFLLTDGDVGNIKDVLDLVRTHSNKNQLFAIGIGEGASTALVKGLARVGNGRAVFVNSGDRKLTGQLVSLLKSSLEPCFTNLSISLENLDPKVTVNAVPNLHKLPNLINGRTYRFYFYLTGLNEMQRQEMFDTNHKITLSGKFGSSGLSVTAEFAQSKSNQLEPNSGGILHRIAARQRIQNITDQMSSEQLEEQPSEAEEEEEEEEKKKEKKKEKKAAVDSPEKLEIIAISKTFNLLSRFTSFIAVDTTTKQALRSKAAPAVRQPFYGGAMYRAMPQSCMFSPPPMMMKCMAAAPAVYYDVEPQSMSLEMDCLDGSVGGGGGEGHDLAAPVAVGCTLYTDPNLAVQAEIRTTVDVLADKATLHGSWAWEAELAAQLGLDLAAANQMRAGLVKDDTVWMTLLVVVYLQSKCGESHDEWELMVEKARRFLASKLEPAILASICDQLESQSSKLFP